MAYSLEFPEDVHQLEVSLRRLIDTARNHRHIHEVEWWLVHYFMQGAREFGQLDYTRGKVDVNYYNLDGELKFRYDWLVSKFQSQLGRLMQINLEPRVSKRNIGLEDLRKAFTAQVALNEAFDKDRVAEIRALSLPILLKYGLLGLMVWNDGDTVGIDVCPPWELLPIPPAPIEDSDIRGIARVRIVPVEWIKKLSYAPGEKNKIWAEMETMDTSPGHMPTGTQESFNTFGQQIAVPEAEIGVEPFGTRKQGKKNQTKQKLAEFVEVWMETPEGLLGEYIVTAGKKLLHRADHEDSRQHMPMNIAHDIPTGGFWSRSFCSILLPMNMELEYSIGHMLQTVQDADAFGILMEPTTMGLPKEIMRGTDGIKRARFEPDYTVPDLKPFNIKPTNLGPGPIKAIQIAVGLAEQLANQPTELMKGDAPGRVDSQKGLGFLYEVSNMPLSPTTESLASAMIGCYKAMLDIINVNWDENRIVDVTMLDDSLAGIKMDPSTGQVTLEAGQIPRAAEVRIDVKSMMPRSVEQEKAELNEALKMGTIDMFEYRVEVRKRSLSLPVGGEAEWQNYRRAVMENISLFGDGKEAGKVIVSQQDMHNVHMRVLLAFMARPEYFQASVEIREAFSAHYEAHLLGDGAMMPDQAPYPEEGAEQEMMLQKMQEQGGMAGGGQPQL